MNIAGTCASVNADDKNGAREVKVMTMHRRGSMEKDHEIEKQLMQDVGMEKELVVCTNRVVGQFDSDRIFKLIRLVRFDYLSISNFINSV